MKGTRWLLLLLFCPLSFYAQNLTSVGGTASAGSSGICIGSGFKDVSKITNTLLDDKATVAMLAGVGCKSWLHTSLNGAGVGGTYAGFHVASASLANLLNNVEVHTFLNGVWQEGATGSNLLSVIVSAEGDIYFKTNKPYNELRLVFNSLLSVAYGANVFYAFGQTTRPDLDVLPVAFQHFKAESNDGRVLLRWQFNTGGSLVRMYVEKSSDGILFATAGVISNNSVEDFTFYDGAQSGKTYYRIKAMVADRAVYSAVQLVNNITPQSGVRVISLAKHALHLELPAAEAGVFTIRLYNMGGQVVHQVRQTLSGCCQVPLPGRGLKSGMYVVQLTSVSGSSISRKVVVH